MPDLTPSTMVEPKLSAPVVKPPLISYDSATTGSKSSSSTSQSLTQEVKPDTKSVPQTPSSGKIPATITSSVPKLKPTATAASSSNSGTTGAKPTSITPPIPMKTVANLSTAPSDSSTTTASNTTTTISTTNPPHGATKTADSLPKSVHMARAQTVQLPTENPSMKQPSPPQQHFQNQQNSQVSSVPKPTPLDPPQHATQQMSRTRSVPISIKPQPHPIAIKPRPIAIAPASNNHHHNHNHHSHNHHNHHHSGSSTGGNQLKSSSFARTASNRGSEEITLTTSKNWILPPRPKVKKNSASSKNKTNGSVPVSAATNTANNSKINSNHIIASASSATPSSSSSPAVATPSSTSTLPENETNYRSNSVGSVPPTTATKTANNLVPPTKIKINSQIHSNINLFTNNHSDLKDQLKNVSKENDNLKKILVKLNCEIDNLKLMKDENSIKSSTMKTSKFSKKQQLQSIAVKIEDSPVSALASKKQRPGDTKEIFVDPNTIDPINLSYNLDSKRMKMNQSAKTSKKIINSVSTVGINPSNTTKSEYYLSPKDIMINPALTIANTTTSSAINNSKGSQRQNTPPAPSKSSTKAKKVESKAALAAQKKAQILLAQQMKQKQELLEKQKRQLEQEELLKQQQQQGFNICGVCSALSPCICISNTKTPAAAATISNTTTDKAKAQGVDIFGSISVPESNSLSLSLVDNVQPPSSLINPDSLSLPTGNAWFSSRNSLMDFDTWNDDLEDMLTDFPILSSNSLLIDNSSSVGVAPGSGTGGIAPAAAAATVPSNTNNVASDDKALVNSPRFDFKFDDNDDFMMY